MFHLGLEVNHFNLKEYPNENSKEMCKDVASIPNRKNMETGKAFSCEVCNMFFRHQKDLDCHNVAKMHQSTKFLVVEGKTNKGIIC